MKVEGGRFALSVAKRLRVEEGGYRSRLRIELPPDLVKHIEYTYRLARLCPLCHREGGEENQVDRGLYVPGRL